MMKLWLHRVPRALCHDHECMCQHMKWWTMDTQKQQKKMMKRNVLDWDEWMAMAEMEYNWRHKLTEANKKSKRVEDYNTSGLCTRNENGPHTFAYVTLIYAFIHVCSSLAAHTHDRMNLQNKWLLKWHQRHRQYSERFVSSHRVCVTCGISIRSHTRRDTEQEDRGHEIFVYSAGQFWISMVRIRNVKREGETGRWTDRNQYSKTLNEANTQLVNHVDIARCLHTFAHIYGNVHKWQSTKQLTCTNISNSVCARHLSNSIRFMW